MRLETDVARRAPFARGRFAPSTTGPAHPGTLLAALLCWLDARSAGAEVVMGGVRPAARGGASRLACASRVCAALDGAALARLRAPLPYDCRFANVAPDSTTARACPAVASPAGSGDHVDGENPFVGWPSHCTPLTPWTIEVQVAAAPVRRLGALD